MNRLKKELKEGKVSLGTVITINAPMMADILARAGFDWLWFDMEHTPLTYETVGMMIQAASPFDVTPVVRVPWNDSVMIKRALDMGPQAIIVPLVNSAAEAEAAVRAVKYPPRGIRGAGIGRAQGYGQKLEEYLKIANDETMVILQIEHIEAVRNIEEILRVEGVDAVFLGPLDLSGTMGLLGQTNHPDVEKAMATVLHASQKAGMPCGIMTLAPDQANHRIKEGYTLVGMGIDVDFILSTAIQMVGQVDKKIKS